MSRREIIAYAISHAPRGQKGGPYEGAGELGATAPTLALAYRYRDGAPAGLDAMWLRNNGHTARVIRIVRARPAPSEASAVEVLRELVAWTRHAYQPLGIILDKAHAVLASAGPDPMPVVRAAMARRDAKLSHERETVSPAPKRQARLADSWRVYIDAEKREDTAVDTYRKAGGK